jgi:cytochrome P450
VNEKASEQPAAPPLVKLITQEFMQDPYPDLAAYRETGSAVAVENGGFRMWLVCGYDEARSLLADPATKRGRHQEPGPTDRPDAGASRAQAAHPEGVARRHDRPRR